MLGGREVLCNFGLKYLDLLRLVNRVDIHIGQAIKTLFYYFIEHGIFGKGHKFQPTRSEKTVRSCF